MTAGQLIALVIAVFFLILLIAVLSRVGVARPLPYFSREFLLSRGEMAFYHSLRRALPGHLIICPKVRMGDVIHCSGEAWKAGYGGKIAQKHVDFILANADTTAIALAIELDDRSHQRSDRQERDDFVDRAFAAAGIPMLRVVAAASYDVAVLRRQIATMVKDTSEISAPA